MRALRIPLLVLAVLLCVSLAWSALLARQCSDWLARLDAAERAVSTGDWQGAGTALGRLEESWGQWLLPLHTAMEHREVDEADRLLRQCLLLWEEKDAAALRAAASDLRCQLSHLSDMEKLSLQNVF